MRRLSFQEIRPQWGQSHNLVVLLYKGARSAARGFEEVVPFNNVESSAYSFPQWGVHQATAAASGGQAVEQGRLQTIAAHFL